MSSGLSSISTLACILSAWLRRDGFFMLKSLGGGGVCVEVVGQVPDLGVYAPLGHCLLNLTEDRICSLDLPFVQFPQGHLLKVNLILNHGLLH